ncbi:DNA polymerase [Dyella sp. ASV21]|uniref:DNA polymerase n=1 Tax=Dyella sp. ASV21 TaxID=2795114 RepID=UPI0018EA50F0|nr:DNA polymerase [Dyella sp. ASV21]
MRYLVFGEETNRYPVALLTRYLRERELANYLGSLAKDTVAYAITTASKAKNPELLAYLKELLPVLCSLQTDYLLVTEASLFKVLTKQQKVSTIGGYVFPCVIEGFKHMSVVYVPSPSQIIYDPSLSQKVEQGLKAVRDHRSNTYMPPGSAIIHYADYPDTIEEISAWLMKLQNVPLAVDIETYGLKHYNAGLGTITMCWSQTEGIAFAVDKDNPPEKAQLIRKMLKNFFIHRNAQTLYHKGNFDVYVLVYQLFMHDLLDSSGMLFGIEQLTRQMDDTLLLAYLATNSCAGNELSLKMQAQEYAGNYAVEVKDISVVPLPQLLEYNLVDGLSTWYVYNKWRQKVIDDQQDEIYRNLFLPALKDIIQMQLSGMPMDMAAVAAGKAEMEADRDAAIAAIMSSDAVAKATLRLNERWVAKRNSELKVKRVSLADAKEVFNLNSSPQLQDLLHEVMGLPVLSRTPTGQAATGMDDLEALVHHCTTDEQRELLGALVAFKQVDKILTSFIPAFEAAPRAPDGWHYLFGFFNLGGTLSGRLSSNEPNLQNIPSTGTKYAKTIKKMFKAPNGWLFIGLDFASLEDRISALTTKDPNKLKVYTDGYDGHSLRAYAYFGNQMPDIEDTVESINSIQTKYKKQRQDSKAPTFALTYQGTAHTLMKNCGFSKELAEQIEARYHELYVVSDQWVAARLEEASQCGYVTVAFGLRLRTPMLAQTILGTRSTPHEASAEGRTAGNALGQSYGLLNTRAGTDFMRQVRQSKWAHEIRPCAHIHDAQYYLVRDDADLLAWVNDRLVKAVQWQELPEIQHDQVKLGGELSIFFPTWANELTIPNGAGSDQILSLAQEHLNQ